MIKCLFWNTNGFGRKSAAIAKWFRHNPLGFDIVGIVETHAAVSQAFLPGYVRLGGANSIGRKGGVCVFRATSATDWFFVESYGNRAACVANAIEGYMVFVIYGGFYDSENNGIVNWINNVRDSWEGPVLVGGDFNQLKLDENFWKDGYITAGFGDDHTFSRGASYSRLDKVMLHEAYGVTLHMEVPGTNILP